ncbi:hypothetical protein A2767_06505 [Candidatus Roizmanbacteria bacterium RIFCSPHIGHO2_01_FULL_35_10]|uniref:Uncharacterized protein n=1 Tax=Candidatus Roizmanbacteria bacterium RIFCSPLOWO2_01_FULL_35_13 TaxID=1802055 RepID=A0A1F7IGY4_9BACT|nr:MAG: hypothetical protein A2767_06505 [Candidatus Roizmanbacteria bacterium RIFCSPHIGHO2_01_FULL_35_10]OGK42613.1 MAG: hypothetical protein A3A74_06280 [Candidatus Roizmanbacteria bacterium RIFCSPLOWO2_01_FULL_35_13]
MLSFYLAGFKKIFSIANKLLLVFVVFSVVIGLFLHFINNDRPKTTYDPVKKNREEIYKTINDPELNKTKEGKIQIAVYRYIMCGLVGEACSNNPSDADDNFNKSVFGSLTKLIVLPYMNPPASGISWTYSSLQDAGFITKTYAAEGIGFGAIKPFAKIWGAFRTVAYLILVLVLISIGFMIMFRMKLNPQTVISVENALPKIVISLILITFSFPIAGFLIDLMYISIILIVSTIGPAAGLNPAQVIDKQRLYIQAGPGVLWDQLGGAGYWWRIFWYLPNALLQLIPAIGYIVRVIGGIMGGYFLYQWLAEKTPLKDVIDAVTKFTAEAEPAGIGFSWQGLGNLIKTPINFVIFAFSVYLGAVIIIPLLLGVIIFLTVILIFFRIILLLFSAYIKILISIIIAPLYLLLESLPGQSAFSSWFKNLVSELIVFPTIVTIFMLVTLIVNAIDTSSAIQFPFMVGIDPKNFSFIVAMAILFLTPEFVKIVKQLFVPKPGVLDMAGLGTFFTGASTGLNAGLGEVSKYAGLGYYIKPLRGILSKVGITYGGEAPHPPGVSGY